MRLSPSDVSIIIPALDEEAEIAHTIASASATGAGEILVVDGGSVDRTRTIAADRGCRVVEAPPGRAGQMNVGAASAKGIVLLFLHSDTRLPPSALAELTRVLSDERVLGGRFDVCLDGSEPIYRVIETLMNLRSRLTGIATGDQAIFVRRSVFEALGGFAPIPLMEDVEFCRRLRRKGALACLRSRVRTSARRWRQHGPWVTMAQMWWLRARYALGTTPERLAHEYGRVR